MPRSALGFANKLGRHRKRIALPALILAAVALLSACNPGTVGVERGWSGPAIEDGILYIGTRSGTFLAMKTEDFRNGDILDLDDENLLDLEWQFPSRENKDLGAIYGTAALSADRVFITQNEADGRDTIGRVFSLYKRDDPENDRIRAGEEVWSFLTEGGIFGSPVLYEDKLYVADDEGFVYALDASAGRDDDPFIWQRAVSDERFWSTPAVSDGVLYIGNMDKNLYAMDVATGDRLWSSPFEAGGAIASTPLVMGDLLYVGAFDRRFYAIERDTGAKRWSFKGDGWFWNDAVPNDDGTKIYVGSLGGSFYALDATDGDQVWRYPAESAVRAAPVIAGNRIYVVTRSGGVAGLDLNTGRSRRSLALNAKALASPAWDGELLFVADLKEKLHAFRVESGEG